MDKHDQHRRDHWTLYILLLFLSVIVLILAFAYRAQIKPAAAVKVTPTPIHNSQGRLSDPDRTFNLLVKGTKLISGPSQITVTKGQSVRVNIKAKGGPISVKLDGYGINTESDPSDNVPGGFSFIADQRGTFPFYSVTTAPTPATVKLGDIIVN